MLTLPLRLTMSRMTCVSQITSKRELVNAIGDT